MYCHPLSIVIEPPDLQTFRQCGDKRIFVRRSDHTLAHSQMIWHYRPRVNCSHFCFHYSNQNFWEHIGKVTKEETDYLHSVTFCFQNLIDIPPDIIISLCILDLGMYITFIVKQ